MYSVQTPSSFSVPQRVLHWLTAALVFFNLLLPDGMNEWNRSIKRTGTATADQVASANIHAYVGVAILILVALRVVLRVVQGVPASSSQEPMIFRLVSPGCPRAPVRSSNCNASDGHGRILFEL
jgi:cytochrome b561